MTFHDEAILHKANVAFSNYAWEKPLTFVL